MKLSVSLPDDDVAFVDEYAEALGLRSRSAVLQRAVKLLRRAELGDAYADAWASWDESDDSVLWEQVSGDALEGTG